MSLDWRSRVLAMCGNSPPPTYVPAVTPLGPAVDPNQAARWYKDTGGKEGQEPLVRAGQGVWAASVVATLGNVPRSAPTELRSIRSFFFSFKVTKI